MFLSQVVSFEDTVLNYLEAFNAFSGFENKNTPFMYKQVNHGFVKQ
jgi:hypothetical protein